MNKVTGQMRSMGCLAVLCGMVLVQPVESAGPVAPNWNALNPVTRLSRATFAHPKMTDWPWVRLNMPASADPKELMSEVSELKQSGVAGIEVGQGAFPNDEQLVAILTRANELGLKVSLSHGPTQYPDG